MSTAVESDVRATPAPSKGEPLLWHNAATIADLLAALLGRPFTAVCGKRCQGKVGEIRDRDLVGPMEHCVICKELTS